MGHNGRIRPRAFQHRTASQTWLLDDRSKTSSSREGRGREDKNKAVGSTLPSSSSATCTVASKSASFRVQRDCNERTAMIRVMEDVGILRSNQAVRCTSQSRGMVVPMIFES